MKTLGRPPNCNGHLHDQVYVIPARVIREKIRGCRNFFVQRGDIKDVAYWTLRLDDETRCRERRAQYLENWEALSKGQTKKPSAL